MNATVALFADLLLKSTLLLLLSGLAALPLRRASAAARHLHWQLTLAGLLVLPLLAPTLPALRVPLPARLAAAAPWLVPTAPHAAASTGGTAARAPARHAARNEITAIIGAASEPPIGPTLTPDFAPGLLPQGASAASHAVLRQSLAPMPRAVVRPTPASAVSVPVPTPAAATAAARAWRARTWSAAVGRWLLPVWLGGAALVIGALVVGLLRAAALARGARSLTDTGWAALADRIRGELGLRRRVRLLLADRPVVPMTWGFLAPVVLLPSDAPDWSPPRRRHVLLHELAHVQRGDWPTQLLAQLVCALYWFQPLAWLAARALRRERERACDDQVLLAGGKASDYADHLLEIARSRTPGCSASSAALAMARRSQLEGRLLAVLDERRDRRLVASRRAVLAGLLAAAIVVPLACMHPQAGSSDAPVTQAAPHAAPPAGPPPAPHLPPGAPAGRPSRAPDGAASEAADAEDEAEAEDADAEADAADAEDAEDAWEAEDDAEDDAGAFDIDIDDESLSALAELGYAKGLRVDMNYADRDFTIHVGGLGDDDHNRWSWSGPDGQMTVDSTAPVVFTDDDRGIAEIGDGTLVIELGGGSGHTRIEVLAGQDGQPRLLGQVAGRDASEPQLREALAGLVLPIARQTGLGAEQRIERIVDREGVPGVLAEIGRLTGDGARLRYAELLPEEHQLTTAELSQLLTLVARDLESDASMEELLACDPSRWLSDPALMEPLTAAVASLDSDAYQAEVIEALLEADELQPAAAAALLGAAAGGIESDAYMAEVLGGIRTVNLRDAAVASAWLAAADRVESDAYLSETLAGLIERDGVTDELRASALQAAAGNIESDAYMAELLEGVETRSLDQPALRTAFLAALAAISSDAYAADVIDARLDERADPALVVALLGAAAAGIESDAYMADVLGSVPSGLLHETSVREAFGKAAETIDSKSYHDEVIALLPPTGPV